MIRPEFSKIENITKTGKGKNIFSKVKRKFLDQNSSRSKTKRIRKEEKLFFCKAKQIFLTRIPQDRERKESEGKTIIFEQSKTIFFSLAVLLSKKKRTASILIEPKKMRKNSEVSFFLLTNAKKRNELFGKYRSLDIALYRPFRA
jgi:hypothetical protein